MQKDIVHYGKNRGRGHNYGRGLGFECNRNGNNKNTYFHQKWTNVEKNDQSRKTNENICYRCGGRGHWSLTCLTPKHLVDLYQKSLKNEDIRIETHFSNEYDYSDYDNMGVTHLDIGDFFVDPYEKIDHLIEDES